MRARLNDDVLYAAPVGDRLTARVAELHNRLRAARTRLGLTQAELAALAQVSRKTINTVENAVFIPSTVLALRLARTRHHGRSPVPTSRLTGPQA